MMTFEQFLARAAALLRIEWPAGTTRYDNLYEDLGLDSFQVFELLIIVEGLAESMVPPVEVPDLVTLDDAFGYYERLVALELADQP